jgi:hypothetical protein
VCESFIAPFLQRRRDSSPRFSSLPLGTRGALGPTSVATEVGPFALGLPNLNAAKPWFASPANGPAFGSSIRNIRRQVVTVTLTVPRTVCRTLPNSNIIETAASPVSQIGLSALTLSAGDHGQTPEGGPWSCAYPTAPKRMIAPAVAGGGCESCAPKPRESARR